MAPLSLNATDGQHCFPSYVDQVATQTKCQQRCFGEAEFSRANEHHFLMHILLYEFAVNAAQAMFERHGHVVGEHLRRGAGPSFTTVDRNEVDTTIAARHVISEFCSKSHFSYGRLDSDWQPRFVSQPLDKVEQSVDVLKFCVV